MDTNKRGRQASRDESREFAYNLSNLPNRDTSSDLVTNMIPIRNKI